MGIENVLDEKTLARLGQAIGPEIRYCNRGGYTEGSEGDFALFSWEAYKNLREHTPEFSDQAALQAGNARLGVRGLNTIGVGVLKREGRCLSLIAQKCTGRLTPKNGQYCTLNILFLKLRKRYRCRMA